MKSAVLTAGHRLAALSHRVIILQCTLLCSFLLTASPGFGQIAIGSGTQITHVVVQFKTGNEYWFEVASDSATTLDDAMVVWDTDPLATADINREFAFGAFLDGLTWDTETNSGFGGGEDYWHLWEGGSGPQASWTVASVGMSDLPAGEWYGWVYGSALPPNTVPEPTVGVLLVLAAGFFSLQRRRTAIAERVRREAGFTMVELLVVIGLIGIVGALGFSAVQGARHASTKAADAALLRNLSVALSLYKQDHDRYFPFREDSKEGTQYWFGYETRESARRGEGQREYDPARSPLGPYAASPQPLSSSFLAKGNAFKPKYRSGYMAIGYNILLGGEHVRQVDSGTVAFATSAQVNTFQAPASPANPMLEEFYLISDAWPTVHFRHGGYAVAVTVDGVLKDFELDPGTLDDRLPREKVGMLDPEVLTP